jgi:hypothetical protein
MFRLHGRGEIGGDPLGGPDLENGAGQRSFRHGLGLYGGRGRALRDVRPVRGSAEARLTLLITLLYVAGAVGVSVYMLVALLRPDKF